MVCSTPLCEIRTDAEKLFENNLTEGFFCSEAIVSVIRKHLAPEMPEALIAAASGFPVGVGGSKCLCGAVSGSVLCIGYFFGRTAPSGIDDPQSLKTMALAHEIQQFFRDQHRVTCCSTHTKDMEMGSTEQRTQCMRFTGQMAEKTAEIIVRELGLATQSSKSS